MKRTRDAGSSSDDDNQFDDGDDLMARAASMMDFDDADEEDSGSEGDALDNVAQEQSGSDAGYEDMEDDGDEEEPQKKKAKRDKGKQRATENGDEAARDMEHGESGQIKSVLQLQVEALLSSVRCPSPSSSKMKSVNAILDQIKSTLLSLPIRPSLPAAQAVQSLPEPLAYRQDGIDLQQVNWQLGFYPPASVSVKGDWPLGMACKWKGKQSWSIDLLVEMPSDLFQEKDVKDYRYFFKRAYFLAVLKEALGLTSLPGSLAYTYLNGDHRKLILGLSPTSASGFSGLKCSIRIIPVLNLDTATFFTPRLYPSRNNVRLAGTTGAPEAPTPIYNASISHDASLLASSAYFADVCQASPRFVEAVLLLKIWARQRGLSRVLGLTNLDAILAHLLAYMVKSDKKPLPRIPAGTAPWQIFKSCIDWLARADLGRVVIASADNRHAAVNKEWQALGKPVLTDPQNLGNLLAEVPLTSLQLLSWDAKLTAKAIKQDEKAAFGQSFLKPSERPHLRFDHTARIHVPLSALKACGALELAEASSSAACCVSRMSRVLRRALSDRVKAISLSIATTDDAPPRTLATVDLGLVLNPEQAARLIEYGPPAEDAAAAKEFKAFWGDISETRRFKDGRIVESVVWNAAGLADRSHVFVQIVRHILRRYLSIPVEHMHFFTGAYDKILQEAPQIRQALYTTDPQEAGFSAVNDAFDGMVKQLKALEGLPLAINNVAPVAEALRYSSIFVSGALKLKALPHVSSAASYIPVHDCLVTFEGSGRWPEDLEALQKVKAAFLIRIGDLFRSSLPGSRCDIQVKLEGQRDGSNCFLDVTLPEGFVFRLHIRHQRERQLLETALLEDVAVFGSDEREHAHKQRLLVAHHRFFTAAPAHHSAIAALQHRLTSFSSTMRTTKRWLAAHFLLSQIPVELVELICAKVYLDTESTHDPPSSGAVGFARVLELLSTWNWREEPLTVPLYTSPNIDYSQGAPTFPAEKQHRAAELFIEARRLDPAFNKATWVISTETDLAGNAWGRGRPSKLVAARVQELARACTASLAECAVAGNEEIEHLFTAPLGTFDFVMHLNPARVPRHSQAIRPNAKALAKRPAGAQLLRPGFDPVQTFINSAQVAIGDAAVLLHDPCGGLAVGGLFNPTLAQKHRDFRIALDFSSMPALFSETGKDNEEQKGKTQVTLDKASLLRELVSRSDGLVERVTTREAL